MQSQRPDVIERSTPLRKSDSVVGMDRCRVRKFAACTEKSEAADCWCFCGNVKLQIAANLSGSNSVVESRLPKPLVAGSIPVSRSSFVGIRRQNWAFVVTAPQPLELPSVRFGVRPLRALLSPIPRRTAHAKLIRVLSNRARLNDPVVSGFNIGTNCGIDAGQTVMHAHMHLIHRRHGDIGDRGGVRGVIPGRQRPSKG